MSERDRSAVDRLARAGRSYFHFAADIGAGIAPAVVSVDAQCERRTGPHEARPDEGKGSRSSRHDVDDDVARHCDKTRGAERVHIATETKLVLCESLHPSSWASRAAVA